MCFCVLVSEIFVTVAMSWKMMREEVQKFAELGAEGIVTGVLTPQGNLDTEQMEAFIKCAGKADVALHRAFDVCKNPFKTMEDAISLGIKPFLPVDRKIPHGRAERF